MTNAELLARLLKSSPASAELLVRDYENVQYFVSDDMITDIKITQGTLRYEIHITGGCPRIVGVEVNDETGKIYSMCIALEPQSDELLLKTLDLLPGISSIFEPKTMPDIDTLRRYAWKISRYCRSKVGCDSCDFRSPINRCPFKDKNEEGVDPAEWLF